MADNIEYITFNNDELMTTFTVVNGVPQPQSTIHINGTIAVDYTNNTYQIVNNISISGDSNGGLGGGGQLTNLGGGQYQINYGNSFSPAPQVLTLTYQGQAPTSAFGLVYNTDPGQSDNKLYSIMSPQPLTSSTLPPVAPCFATGTTITTERGPVKVEDLAVGDMALTSAGTHSRIRWIGHRTVDCRRHFQRDLVMPVRISAHAFGPDAPARDLVVSPGHAICLDVCGEVLIPAHAMVNGTTIVQENVETITYWHVELDSHDVILAENLPCESYLEMGNRDFFADAAAVTLHAGPDAPVATHADFCRPFVASGVLLEAARARLAARAAQAVRTCEGRTA